MLSLFLLIGVFIPSVFADAALTTARFEGTGNYGLVASGVGLYGTTSGDITINVLGTSVIAGYLYWAGYNLTTVGGDDDGVSFDGNAITTYDVYGPDLWLDEATDKYHYVYVAEVTALVNLGSDTYTIADVELEHNYGAGLIVVYEDLTLPTSLVQILDGLDALWFNFPDPRGPNSEVTSFDFDPNIADRTGALTLFVGGVMHDDRPNDIWTGTGTGPKPTNLITTPSSPSGTYPLEGADGEQWDTYADTILIPAVDEWLCVQVESIPSWETGPAYAGRGSSALLIAAGFVLPIEDREAPGVGTPGFWKKHPDAWPVDAITIGGAMYTKAQAIAIMDSPGKGDKTHEMFNQLVAAKLNVLIGNPSGCVDDTIDAADDWLTAHPIWSGVKGNHAAWQDDGEALKDILDDYNNGLLCAPSRD